MNVFFFLFNAGACALNAALYAAWGNPLSLAVAILCGLGALLHLVWEMAS